MPSSGLIDRDLSAFDFRVVRTDAMTPADRESAFALFDMAYRQANHAYLEKSFGVLRYFAMATHQNEPAGFSLAEMRVMDLPRLPRQAVTLAGICCIAPEFRRRGLFSYLEALAIAHGVGPPPGRHLRAGRMAHYGTRYVEAAERLEEAAALYERVGEPRLHAAASAVLTPCGSGRSPTIWAAALSSKRQVTRWAS